MPTIHVFQAGCSDTVGYTLDPDGSNLPRGIVRGAWERIGEVEIGRRQSPRAGADAALVQVAIERDGFYVAVGGVNLTTSRPRRP